MRKGSRKWLALDAMGVVFEVSDDVRDLLVPFLRDQRCSASFEKIKELYMWASCGRISSASFWAEMGLRSEYPDVEKHYLDSCLTIDPGFKDVSAQLAKKHRMALLSNDVKEWSDHLRKRFGLGRLFDAVVVSGDVGHRKPDPKIYQILLDRIEAPPGDCVLVDDRLSNLRAAHEMGLRTIWFAREGPNDDFTPDAQVASFDELPRALEEAFQGHQTPSG